MRKKIYTGLAALVLLNCFASAKLLVIDDYNRKNTDVFTNSLNHRNGTWASFSDGKTIGCYVAIEPKYKIGATGSSLRIRYNLDSAREIRLTGNASIKERNQKRGEVCCGYYTQVLSNLTGYKYLSMYIKGDPATGYTRRLPVELKDSAHNSSRYIIEGIGPKWKKFVIPLRAFKRISNWHSVTELVIIFDGNVTRKNGELYVDNIAFTGETGKVQASVIKASASEDPILVDGKLKDWDLRKAGKLKLSGKINKEYGSIRNKRDLSADIFTSWDEENLYLYIGVRDNDVVFSDDPDSSAESDYVELFFDTARDGFVWGGSDDYDIIFTGKSATIIMPEGIPAISENLSYSTKLLSNGYCIEISLRWDFLNTKPVKGTVINFSIAVQDVDIKDKTGSGRLNWKYVPGKKIILGELVLG